MPAASAWPRRGDPHRPAPQPDLARVGRIEPEEDARELGAAGAHETGQAEDLAGSELRG